MPHLWALGWTYLAVIRSANCVILLLLISQGNKREIPISLWHTKAVGFTWHASFKINLINSLSWFLKAGGCASADSTAQGCVFRSGFRAAVSISCAQGAATAECLQLLQPCCHSVLGHLCPQKGKYKTVDQAFRREGLGLNMSPGNWRRSDDWRRKHQKKWYWGLSNMISGSAMWPWGHSLSENEVEMAAKP